MTVVDALVLLVCGLVGWALVSWLIGLVQQQRAPPFPIGVPPPASARALPAPSAIADMAASWRTILEVGEHATAQEIDTAYQRRLAECDREAFAAPTGTAAHREAEARRARIVAAYEFSRSVRPT